jgi:hypothetical protein
VTNPTSNQSESRVLPFRRRGSLLHRNVPQPPLPDLEKYERAPEEPDDFRHRMVMNALGLLVTVALIVAGIWMAEVMAHMRKDQDCVLMGRSNCAHLDVPARQR